MTAPMGEVLRRWRTHHERSSGRALRELAEVLARRPVLEDTLRVAVTGAFSSGKSTLISVLLQENVAEAHALPTTHCATLFVYSTVPFVEVVDADGRKRLAVRLNDRRSTLGRWLSGEEIVAHLPPAAELDAARVTIGLPHPLLYDVTLFDTPGHDALRDGDHDLALGQASSLPAFLYLCQARHLLGQVDLEVLASLCSPGKRWALVITHLRRKAFLPGYGRELEAHVAEALAGWELPPPDTILLGPDPRPERGQPSCADPLRRREAIVETLQAWQKGR